MRATWRFTLYLSCASYTSPPSSLFNINNIDMSWLLRSGRSRGSRLRRFGISGLAMSKVLQYQPRGLKVCPNWLIHLVFDLDCQNCPVWRPSILFDPRLLFRNQNRDTEVDYEKLLRAFTCCNDDIVRLKVEVGYNLLMHKLNSF